jgi:tetratricopeptide (TPR) repeat protein
MRTAGGAALQRQDFKAAVDLLKRAADQDPKQKDLWDDLGRAYAGLNQHDDAIAAFRKQIEIDPYHAHANGDLAAELQQQGKLEDAVAAYRKQVEITPSDQLPHKNLGLLLAQMKRDDEARAELETAASIPPDDAQIKLALAQVYGRSGNKEKSEALMKAVTGSSAPDSGSDIFASALKDNMDPNEALHDARETLDDIGDHFDSGEYDRLGPSAYSAMNLVALGWARIGWAKFLQGDLLEAMQYMNSAWMLTQSGTIGTRLARVLEKENQREKARHMFAMAVAAGGPEAQASRDQVTRLAASPDDAQKEIAGAAAELLQERTVKLSGLPTVKGSARFALVFEQSNQPTRAEYLDGDAALQGVGDKLRSQSFPVKFPDASSVKIIRRAKVSCDGAGCSAVLLLVESLQP